MNPITNPAFNSLPGNVFYSGAHNSHAKDDVNSTSTITSEDLVASTLFIGITLILAFVAKIVCEAFTPKKGKK